MLAFLEEPRSAPAPAPLPAAVGGRELLQLGGSGGPEGLRQGPAPASGAQASCRAVPVEGLPGPRAPVIFRR